MENKIEAEIAELTKQIESKRRVLESKKGFIEEKDLVRQAVGEKISAAVPTYTPRAASVTTTNAKSYLDSADEDTANMVNELLQKVFSEGMALAMKQVKLNDPYIIDMFHDALTDKLYEKLKADGIVK